MRFPMSMSGCDLRRRTERITVMGAPVITSGAATESFACPQNYPGTCPEFTRSYFGLDACRPTKHFPEQRFVSGLNESTGENVNGSRPIENISLRIMIARTILLALVMVFIVSTSTANAQPQVNKPQLAGQVRAEFLHAWIGYKKYAWGHDDLKPLSKTYHDWYARSLLMTPVDALDTMILMGLKEEAKTTREYIDKNLSFY